MGKGLVYKIWDGIKFPLIGLTLIIGVARGCNELFNTFQKEGKGANTNSKATGIMGHREFTKYKDNSIDLKIYPNLLGHRLLSSKLYQDLDGDKRVDRIRINSPEWKYHKLKKVLVRDFDYNLNQEEFGEADRILTEELERYNLKFN